MDDKRKYRDLSGAIKETDKEIDRLFDRAVRQVSALLTSSGADTSAITDGALFLTLHPEIRDGIREITAALSADLLRSMQAGIVRGWDLAEEHASATIAAYIGNTTPDIRETLRRALLDRRRGAVTPFLRSRLEERVSDSVWRTSEQARHHITDSVAAALEEGLSADDLSRRIRQDLREPSRLFRRVRDKETGTLRLSKPAQAYHPGQGVYRSSYKNAKRLARTEINIAYRTSDYERWQGKDFVLGFRIHLSGNHTCNGVPFSDICDDLEGVYPKTFKFTGWHPQCRCIATPILEEADHCFRRILTGEGEAPEPITDLPPQMDEWMKKNAARLRRADARGTTPYWVRDNFSKEGKGGNGGKPPKPPRHSPTTPEDPDEERRRRTLRRAEARHNARTSEEILSVRKSWNNRQVARATGTHFEPGGMSFADADNGMGNVFHSTNKEGYMVNCQSCVVAHEMRLRGHSVTARPNTKMKNNMPYKLSRKTEMAWIDPVTKTSPVVQKAGGWTGEYNARGLVVKTIAQRKKEFLENTKTVGRYHMSFVWKGRKPCAHIVTLERKPNGDLFLYDPQTNASIAGEGKVIDFIKERISQIYPIKTYRVDNLLADVNVVKRVVYKTMTDL